MVSANLRDKIIAIDFKDVEYRLKKPYVLSFDTLRSLTSIQVSIKIESGDERIAETVPLVGYSEETRDSIHSYLGNVTKEIKNLSLIDARKLVEKSISVCPFACSPILTALDLFSMAFDISNGKQPEFVIPATSTDLKELKNIADSTATKGGGTIKVKLSGALNKDLACLEYLNSTQLQNIFIRFDANKAFSLTDACWFYEKLEISSFLERVHYIEQPLVENDWKGHEYLISHYKKAKTMLDESIVTEQDLQKATAIKVPFVKFKLFKQGGIKELIHLSESAHKNKIHVVLGNGVATKISNDLENKIYNMYRHLFFGASEANGFLKIA